MMKTFLLVLMTLCTPAAMAQMQPLFSHGYDWESLAIEPTDTGERRQILEGSTTDLEYLTIDAITLEPGATSHADQAHNALEELVIVKEGILKVSIEGEESLVGPGSVAVFLPGDGHGLENAGDTPVTYYVFQYRSKAPVDVARGKGAGGSFVVDWNDVVMEETETGGRRQHFDRATAMFERFEMHVSTLNDGLTNHEAHTHRAEEFVLILTGEVEMLIGEAYQEAFVGDLLFLASEIPHALRNIGSTPTEYFAFQWQ